MHSLNSSELLFLFLLNISFADFVTKIMKIIRRSENQNQEASDLVTHQIMTMPFRQPF